LIRHEEDNDALQSFDNHTELLKAVARRLHRALPPDQRAAVAGVLSLCGVSLQLNRAVAFSLTGGLAVEWHHDGLAPALAPDADLSEGALGDWASTLSRGETVLVTGGASKDASWNATQCALLEGSAALLVVPLHVGGRLIGIAAFGAPADLASAFDSYAPTLQLVTDLFSDTFELARVKAALHACEERFEVAVRGTGVALWEWHVQTGATRFDERWAEIVGYTLAEISPVNIDTWVRLVHPDDLATSGERLQAHFHGETPLYECEARMRHKSGDWVWVLDRGRVFERDGDGQPLRMAGTHLDITAHKQAQSDHQRLQQELQQSQKLESIGRLAGGVAHDFNNLLMVVSGYAEMLDAEEPATPTVRDCTQMIRDAAARGQDLTRQLLAFSRKQIINPRLIDMNLQVEQLLKMYRRLIGEDILVEFTPAPDLSVINADPQQLDQMLANLLVNARDALHARAGMTPARRIQLELRSLEVSDEDESFLNLPAGPYVVLSVGDNGVGMDEATLANIFDPFFTTKSRENGTGLGLSTVLGIVEQNHGTIRVYSEPDNGTTFRIIWPAVPGEPITTDRQPATTGALCGNETIVLAEDEVGVRECAARALARLGYRVIPAADCPSAMSLIDNLGAAPALLITDVVMPGGNGHDVARHAQARFPGLPVLYMSGYTDEVIARHGIVEAGVELIEKPFTISALTHRIRALLDGR
jgi:PAS domain S-box-containing protein